MPLTLPFSIGTSLTAVDTHALLHQMNERNREYWTRTYAAMHLDPWASTAKVSAPINISDVRPVGAQIMETIVPGLLVISKPSWTGMDIGGISVATHTHIQVPVFEQPIDTGLLGLGGPTGSTGPIGSPGPAGNPPPGMDEAEPTETTSSMQGSMGTKAPGPVVKSTRHPPMPQNAMRRQHQPIGLYTPY